MVDGVELQDHLVAAETATYTCPVSRKHAIDYSFFTIYGCSNDLAKSAGSRYDHRPT